MWQEFDGKVVLVTGSSSGIGEATALCFAKLGSKVVITGRDESRVERVAKLCQEISPHNLQVFPKNLINFHTLKTRLNLNISINIKNSYKGSKVCGRYRRG